MARVSARSYNVGSPSLHTSSIAIFSCLYVMANVGSYCVMLVVLLMRSPYLTDCATGVVLDSLIASRAFLCWRFISGYDSVVYTSVS